MDKLKDGRTMEAKARKLKARYLIVVKGYNQKEAAKELNVSENTISAWAIKGKWNDKILNPVKHPCGIEKLVEKFLIDVSKSSPGIYKEVLVLWKKYLQKLNKGLI